MLLSPTLCVNAFPQGNLIVSLFTTNEGGLLYPYANQRTFEVSTIVSYADR